MKKTPVIIVALLMTLFGCREDKGPRPVAEKFLEAMQDRNYKLAGEFGTTETIKLLQQFEKIEKLNGGLEVTQEKAGKITIVSEDIHGKNATVYFKEEDNPSEQHISLVKTEVDGKEQWKVDLRKEEIRMIQE